MKYLPNETTSVYYAMGGLVTIIGIAICVLYKFYAKKNNTNVQDNNQSSLSGLDLQNIEKFQIKKVMG